MTFIGLQNYVERHARSPLDAEGIIRAAMFTALFLPGMIFIPDVPGRPDRPRHQSQSRDVLSADPAHPGDDSRAVDLPPLEVDV